MVIISPAVDDADPLARAPRAEPPATNNNLDPAAALSHFDVVHGTTATADVGAGTTAPLWSSPPPYYAGSSGAYASASFPPPPPPQSHGNDLARYAGSTIDASFPQLPAPPVYMQPEELSYFYYPQPQQGFPPCFAAASFALENATAIRPELLQVPTTQPASMPPSLQYPQTQATTTGSASVEEEASPALADTQQAQEDDTANRPAPRRRRGRPSKRAPAMSSEPTKRVIVGRNRAAPSSQKTSSAATGSATMPSAAGQVPDDQAGASSSSTGGASSGQQQTAACTSTDDDGAPAGVVVERHQQQQHAAAIAPPPELTTTTTGASYADTSAVGVRFHPTDQELIAYLRLKYARQQIPVDFFTEFDVYQAHPMAIKGACGESQNGCWYAFSRRDRKYRNGQRPARSVFAEGGGGQQVGFWKSNSKLGEVRVGGRKRGAVIGRMASLTFQLGRQPRGKQTGWKMREYTIPENQRQADGSAMLLNDWVVCMLFYKERPTCTTNTESKKDEEDAMSVGQEPPMHGKSEKGKNGISVGQKRPRRSRKSRKDKNNVIPVAVEQDDEPAAAGEKVNLVRAAAAQGEEDMQEMVPAAHQQQQASDYSEQDLCVEDYLVSDLVFVQQNDAANCTI